ncbi:MAG: enoyl-CoA hydratase [Desulfobacterales bacterium]|nr:enoyl-CoA hydratase [Desulfobacterales bacterium]
MEDPVLIEYKNQAATITLNRPERKNAINEALLRGLYDGLEKAASDDEIRVIIITGKGSAFCAGLDLGCLETENLVDPRGDGRDLVDIAADCRKPIIGAVNGPAVTGGFELALNCDFLIASEKAAFADTHARIGIRPGWGMTQLLQHAVGQRLAKQFSLTCQWIPAEQALACGIVNEVLAPEELMPRAEAIARMICETDNETALTVKDLIEYRNRSTFAEALENERKPLKDLVAASGTSFTSQTLNKRN